MSILDLAIFSERFSLKSVEVILESSIDYVEVQKLLLRNSLVPLAAFHL